MTKISFYQTKSGQKNKGFTILEVMGAIFILTIGIGGAFLLVQQSLSAASINKDRLIAAYLAQEGIEIVRNIRDTNWLKSQIWDTGFMINGDYSAAVSSTALSPFSAGTYLKVDPNRMYNTSTGVTTKFQRKISITNIATSTSQPVEKKKVEVTVLWSERGRAHSLSVLEYLQNWYERQP